MPIKSALSRPARATARWTKRWSIAFGGWDDNLQTERAEAEERARRIGKINRTADEQDELFLSSSEDLEQLAESLHTSSVALLRREVAEAQARALGKPFPFTQDELRARRRELEDASKQIVQKRAEVNPIIDQMAEMTKEREDLTAEIFEASKTQAQRHRDVILALRVAALIIVVFAAFSWIAFYFASRTRGTPFVVVFDVIIMFLAIVAMLNPNRWERGKRFLSTVVLIAAANLLVSLFATWTWNASESSSMCFNHALTKTDTLYFLVSLMTTTGLGDLRPVSQSCRQLVTGEMVAFFIFDAVVVVTVIAYLLRRVSGGSYERISTPAAE